MWKEVFLDILDDFTRKRRRMFEAKLGEFPQECGSVHIFKLMSLVILFDLLRPVPLVTNPVT
jgi:hypothetical protein